MVLQGNPNIRSCHRHIYLSFDALDVIQQLRFRQVLP